MEYTVDLRGCNPATIRSRRKLRRFVRDICHLIGMRRFGPTLAWRFALDNPKTGGYTVSQWIRTSNIGLHCSEAPERRSVHLNVFTCRIPADVDGDAARVASYAVRYFNAQTVTTRIYYRW